MEKLLIKGGNPLSGKVTCSGAKNAALPMIASTILCDEKVVLKNLPYLQDITTMFELLGSMGSEIVLDENMNFTICSDNLSDIEARYELVKTMRASFYVLGPLISRFGRVQVSLPGGCAWGPRPVDYHLKGLEQLGAKLNLESGNILAEAEILLLLISACESMGLTKKEFKVFINDRRILNSILSQINVPKDMHNSVMVILDKRDKIEV